MQFTSTETGGVVVMSLDGAVLGGPEAAALKSELRHMIEAGKLKAVIDLSRVTLMNSTGLGLLIGSYTSLRNAGGELALAGANENIRKLLDIARLHTVFRSYPGVSEAVAELS